MQEELAVIWREIEETAVSANLDPTKFTDTHREIVAQWGQGELAQRCGVRSLLTLPWRWEGLCDLASLEHLLAELEGGALIDHASSA